MIRNTSKIGNGLPQEAQAEGFAIAIKVPQPKHYQKSMNRPQKSSACKCSNSVISDVSIVKIFPIFIEMFAFCELGTVSHRVVSCTGIPSLIYLSESHSFMVFR